MTGVYCPSVELNVLNSVGLSLDHAICGIVRSSHLLPSVLAVAPDFKIFKLHYLSSVMHLLPDGISRDPPSQCKMAEIVSLGKEHPIKLERKWKIMWKMVSIVWKLIWAFRVVYLVKYFLLNVEG